jgi:hypothetical protein
MFSAGESDEDIPLTLVILVDLLQCQRLRLLGDASIPRVYSDRYLALSM